MISDTLRVYIGMFIREVLYRRASVSIKFARFTLPCIGREIFSSCLNPFRIPVINFIELLAAFLALVILATTCDIYDVSCIFAKSSESGFRLEKLKHDSWLSLRVRRDVVFLRGHRARARQSIFAIPREGKKCSPQRSRSSQQRN